MGLFNHESLFLGRWVNNYKSKEYKPKQKSKSKVVESRGFLSKYFWSRGFFSKYLDKLCHAKAETHKNLYSQHGLMIHGLMMPFKERKK